MSNSKKIDEIKAALEALKTGDTDIDAALIRAIWMLNALQNPPSNPGFENPHDYYHING